MEENQNEAGQEIKSAPKNNVMLYGGITLVAVLLLGGVLLAKAKSKAETGVLSDTSVNSGAGNNLSNSLSEENSESREEAQSESETIPSSTATVTAATQNLENTAATTINVEGGMYYFKPDVIKVKKGQPVKIVFSNKEGIHDFVIDEFNVKSKMTREGQTDTIEFTPDKTGTFEYYCSVGTHRQMGMKGSLIVQ